MTKPDPLRDLEAVLAVLDKYASVPKYVRERLAGEIVYALRSLDFGSDDAETPGQEDS